MYWSHVWIMSTVWCLALYISALVKAEWSSDSSKKGSLKSLTKDIVTLILTFLSLFQCCKHSCAKNCSKVRHDLAQDQSTYASIRTFSGNI